MSNYIITPDGELYHHGVKGMKWGVRRAAKNVGISTRGSSNSKELLTNYTAKKKARLAAEKAEASARSKARKQYEGKIGGLRKMNNAAKSARKDAYTKSISESKAYNKKIRADRAERKKNFREARRDASGARSHGAKLATNVLAGPFANRTYNSVIAAGGSKTGARIATGLTSLGGPLAHVVVSSLYTRAAGKQQLEKRFN